MVLFICSKLTFYSMNICFLSSSDYQILWRKVLFILLYTYLFLIGDKALAFLTCYSITIFIRPCTHFIGSVVLLSEKEAESLA
jgi:hypothetical protein